MNISLLVDCFHIFGDPADPAASHPTDATLAVDERTGDIVIQASLSYIIRLMPTTEQRRTIARLLMRKIRRLAPKPRKEKIEI